MPGGFEGFETLQNNREYICPLKIGNPALFMDQF